MHDKTCFAYTDSKPPKLPQNHVTRFSDMSVGLFIDLHDTGRNSADLVGLSSSSLTFHNGNMPFRCRGVKGHVVPHMVDSLEEMIRRNDKSDGICFKCKRETSRLYYAMPSVKQRIKAKNDKRQLARKWIERQNRYEKKVVVATKIYEETGVYIPPKIKPFK